MKSLPLLLNKNHTTQKYGGEEV